jgi:large subunit ribosomal protein L1
MKQVNRKELYQASDALALLKKLATDDGAKDKKATKVKFDESVEIALNLNLKAKHTIRDTFVLPNSSDTKEKIILVFAKGDKAAEAEEAGATYVGDSDLVEKIKGGWFEFDVAIATPDMMKEVGKLGPVLGRRGLMPNPKTGTVTLDLKNAINEFKRGKVEFRADKTGIIHLKVGKVSMADDAILENAKTLYHEVLRKKPTDLKGEYIKSVALSTTMGPGIKIVHQSLN